MAATQPSNCNTLISLLLLPIADGSTYCSSPLDSHSVEHIRREQREHATKQTPHKRVCSYGRGRKHQIRVDDVVEQAEEDGENAEAGEEAG